MFAIFWNWNISIFRKSITYFPVPITMEDPVPIGEVWAFLEAYDIQKITGALEAATAGGGHK